MKKWLIGFVIVLLLAGLTLSVMAADDMDARLNRQQKRIHHLAKSGEISSKDQQRLDRELNHIRERSRELQRRMDRLDDDIDQARRQRKELIPGVPFPKIPTPR